MKVVRTPKKRVHSKVPPITASRKHAPIVSALTFKGQKGFISKESLDKLRGEDDFIDLVKVMRLSNVLTYVVNLILTETNKKDPVDRRAHARNRFNIGGYVYEGFRLIQDMEKRHGGKAYFSGFRKILERIAKKRPEKILHILRNNGAFHLDHANYSTRSALAKMNHVELEVIAANENSYLATYFPLADDVDLNYLVDELAKSDSGTKNPKLTLEEENELVNEIFMLVADLSKEMAFETHRFVLEVSKRVGLMR